jgi:hypothetical protein
VKTRASATSSVKLKCESSALGVQANDQALRGMFFTEPALLNRQLLSDLLRPLAGLSFRLGVAAGLASVAVVGDDDFRKPFAQRTPRTSPTRPSRQSPRSTPGYCIHAHHAPTELRVDMWCCL